jgi:hypothetical protein
MAKKRKATSLDTPTCHLATTSLKPLNDPNIPGSTWSCMLKSYQKGTDIRP